MLLSKTSRKGFVLPVILFFMQLFALLGLYGLQLARMQFNVNRDAWQYNQYEREAVLTLTEIENTFMLRQPNCILPIGSTNELNQKPLTWWQLVSCSGNLAGNQYHYLLEFLGKDTCAVIVQKDKKVMAHYYRISLLWLPEETNNVKVVLQSTVAIAGDDMPACQERSHVVIAGRQMLRRLG